MPSVSPLPLAADPPALAARYRVQVTPVDARCPSPAPMEWLYLRDHRQVRQVKGALERVWTREAGGGLRFAQYPAAGAPASPWWLAGPRTSPLGPDDWPALCSFIDCDDLRRLRADSATPRQAGRDGYTLREQGLVDLLWDTARQLPLRMTRVLACGTVSHTLLSVEPPH